MQRHSKLLPEIFAKAMSLGLLYTDMRLEKHLELQWEDIDFEHRKIHIRHTLTDVGDKHFLTTPKTAPSIRDLYYEVLFYVLSTTEKGLYFLFFLAGETL